MSSIKETSGGGQHRAPNHGPTGANSGQRSILLNPEQDPGKAR
jgi:hypothetical protein